MLELACASCTPSPPAWINDHTEGFSCAPPVACLYVDFNRCVFDVVKSAIGSSVTKQYGVVPSMVLSQPTSAGTRASFEDSYSAMC
jgi:hypothetical protein